MKKQKKRLRLPPGMGQVVRVPGNRRKSWWVRKKTGVNPNGSPLHLTIGFSETWEDGIELLINYNNNPYSKDLRKMTLNAIYPMLIEQKLNRYQVQGKEYAKSTQNGWRSALLNLQPIADIPMMDLTTRDIEEYYKTLMVKKGALKIVRVLLCELFEYAIENGLPIMNLAKRISLSTYQVQKPRIIFTIDEINRLWKTAHKNEIASIIVIFLYTGFRANELLKMRISDIDLLEMTFIGGSKTASGKNRIVPIHENILPIVERMYNQNKNKEFLLVNKAGKPYTYEKFKMLFFELTESMGQRHVIHETRHTFATYLQAKNPPEAHVKLILGHKNQDITTGLYNHVGIKQLKQTINLLEYVDFM